MPEVILTFTTVTDFRRLDQIAAMMRALYAEDEAASPVDQARFAENIKFLVSHPWRGSIILFGEGGSLCGYALVVPYWSNEFGGTLLFIDELFVVPEARRRGIGRSFFKYLDEVRPFEAVALALEVSPSNKDARRLYESLGFYPRRHSILTRVLLEPS